jgi:hypothetical protein
MINRHREIEMELTKSANWEIDEMSYATESARVRNA